MNSFKWEKGRGFLVALIILVVLFAIGFYANYGALAAIILLAGVGAMIFGFIKLLDWMDKY